MTWPKISPVDIREKADPANDAHHPPGSDPIAFMSRTCWINISLACSRSLPNGTPIMFA
jgi:hypothetical protein